MRNYESLRIRETIIAIKYMQKMNFDKYVILNNLDSMIENLRINASNEFINCLFDIRQKVVLDKEIKQEVLKMLPIQRKISSFNYSSRNGNGVKFIVLHYTGNKGDTEE